MTKQIYTWLIFILGFVLIPRLNYACGSNSEKCCQVSTLSTNCLKQSSHKSDKKDLEKLFCCKKNNHHSKDSQNHGCGGNCNHSSCHCTPSNISFIVPFLLSIKNTNINLLVEKQKISHIEIYLTSGFYSIWTPPNIG